MIGKGGGNGGGGEPAVEGEDVDLAEVRTIDDAKHVMAMADAAHVYAKRIGASREVKNSAAQIHLRAERALGLILKKHAEGYWE